MNRKIAFATLVLAMVFAAVGGFIRVTIAGSDGPLTEQQAINSCAEHLAEDGPLPVFSAAHATLTHRKWSVRGTASAPYTGFRCIIDNTTGDVVSATYLRQ